MKEKVIRSVAGVFVLTSILLAIYVDIHWLWMTAFVGFNLLQSSFSEFCPLDKILDKIGVK